MCCSYATLSDKVDEPKKWKSLRSKEIGAYDPKIAEEIRDKYEAMCIEKEKVDSKGEGKGKGKAAKKMRKIITRGNHGDDEWPIELEKKPPTY